MLSFALESEAEAVVFLNPRWYRMGRWAVRHKHISRNDEQHVSWPKSRWRNWLYQLSPLT